MSYKTIESISVLKVGDIIRHKSGGKAFVVTGNYGHHVTAVASVDVTNPHEWERLVKPGERPVITETS